MQNRKKSIPMIQIQKNFFPSLESISPNEKLKAIWQHFIRTLDYISISQFRLS